MRPRHILTACAIIGAISALAGPATHRWTVETSKPAATVCDAFQGETIYLEPTLLSYGTAASVINSTLTLYWQTNGMGSAWWSKPADADHSVTGRIRAIFAPTNDIGAAQYTFFIQATDTNASNYRAYGLIRMRSSPGYAPTAAPAPGYQWVSPADMQAAIDAATNPIPAARAAAIDAATNPVPGWIDAATNPVPGWIAAATNPVPAAIAAATNPIPAARAAAIAAATNPVPSWIAAATNPIPAAIAAATNPIPAARAAAITAATNPIPSWITAATNPIPAAQAAAIAAATNPIPAQTAAAITAATNPIPSWITAATNPIPAARAAAIAAATNPIPSWITAATNPIPAQTAAAINAATNPIPAQTAAAITAATNPIPSQTAAAINAATNPIPSQTAAAITAATNPIPAARAAAIAAATNPIPSWITAATNPIPAQTAAAINAATNPIPSQTAAAINAATNPIPAQTAAAINAATNPIPAARTAAITAATNPIPTWIAAATNPIPSQTAAAINAATNPIPAQTAAAINAATNPIPAQTAAAITAATNPIPAQTAAAITAATNPIPAQTAAAITAATNPIPAQTAAAITAATNPIPAQTAAALASATALCAGGYTVSNWWEPVLTAIYRATSAATSETTNSYLIYANALAESGLIDWSLAYRALDGWPPPPDWTITDGTNYAYIATNRIWGITPGRVTVQGVSDGVTRTSILPINYGKIATPVSTLSSLLPGSPAALASLPIIAMASNYLATTTEPLVPRPASWNTNETYRTNYAAVAHWLPTPTWNTNCWLTNAPALFACTAFAVGTTPQASPLWHGTLISPRIIVKARHVRYNLGQTHWFLAPDGSLTNAVLSRWIDLYPDGGPDIVLGVLDRAMPTSMVARVATTAQTAAAFPAPTGLSKLAFVQAVAFNQHLDASVLELSYDAWDLGGYTQVSWRSPTLPQASTITPLYHPAHPGDSGCPIILAWGNTPVLLSLYTYAGAGSSISASLTDIAAALATEGEALTYIDFGGTP
jgi:hypothetical protein